MHAALVQLTPIIGAEKSKTPLYIAGGLLVAWALILSMGIGMRVVSFPSGLAAQRAIMAVSAALVVLTVAMAIATAGGSTSKATVSPPAVTSPIAPSAAEQSGEAASKPGAKAKEAGGTTLTEAANPEGQLSYTNKSLTAKAGRITIDFSNSSPLMHNMTIAQGSTVIGATPTFQGGTKTLTLDLKPGKYVFYCSVPGHREAGMEGTLTVQ